MKDNTLQKDGYKFMLDYMAKRRRTNPNQDISREEVKFMNGVKMLVESGWVVDEHYFKHLQEVSGIDVVYQNYRSAKSEKQKIDGRTIQLLRFANKFAENLGMADLFVEDRLVKQPRMPNEVFFSLDPTLYGDCKPKQKIQVGKKGSSADLENDFDDDDSSDDGDLDDLSRRESNNTGR